MCKESVSEWISQLKQVSVEIIYVYIYLCNEIVQKAAHDKQKDFVNEFRLHLPAAMSYVSLKCYEKDRDRVKRVLNIWRQRNIYPTDCIDELEKALSTHSLPLVPPPTDPRLANQASKVATSSAEIASSASTTTEIPADSKHPLIKCLLDLQQEAVEGACPLGNQYRVVLLLLTGALLLQMPGWRKRLKAPLRGLYSPCFLSTTIALHHSARPVYSLVVPVVRWYGVCVVSCLPSRDWSKVQLAPSPNSAYPRP